MSLRVRIRRCAAELEWLEERGPLRQCELDLRWLEMKQQVETRLARTPGDAAARRMAGVMGLALPPPTEPEPESEPEPEDRPPRDPRFRDSSCRHWTWDNVVRVPPASWPPPVGAPLVDWFEDGPRGREDV